MDKIMLITVGTGRDREDIAGAISLSITRESPKRIIFLASPLSNNETIPLIDKAVLQSRAYEVNEFSETDDVEELYKLYAQTIQRILREGCKAQDIVIDYTSGTKAMSAALFAAGIAMEVGSINYIAGKRDKTGKVIPGQERPIPIKPLALFAENRIKRAQELFDIYQFQAARVLLTPLKATIGDPSLKSRIDFLLKLIEGYSLWDTFKLKNAVLLFGKINADGALNTHPIKDIFLQNFSLLNESAHKKYSTSRLVDLRQNICRRMEEGKYDDALARIYRLFEYLAQIKLYKDHNKLETEHIKISSLPPRLRAKYEKMADRKAEVQLSMVRVFELLADLQDDMGVNFMNQYKQDDSALRELLNKRNKSILAHGFSAIEKEDCEKLINIITVDILNRYFPGWEAEQTKAIFPKLSETG